MLAMCGVKLLIVPMVSKRFALYLVGKEHDARNEHHKIYGKLVDEIIDVGDRMDTEPFCEETKKWRSFRALKQEVLQFPYYAGLC